MDKKVEINIKDCSDRFVAFLGGETLNNLNNLKKLAKRGFTLSINS